MPGREEEGVLAGAGGEELNQSRLDVAQRESKNSIEIFKPDALNLLGRTQKQARDRLYARALDKPSAYVERRSELIHKFTDGMIDEMNDRFFYILAYGQKVNQDGSRTQLMTYPGGSDPYVPGIPKATISAFCVKVMETVEDMCVEAFEMMYPKDHLRLATARISSATSDGEVSK